MNFIRNTSRKFKHASEIDKINGIIDKYVDLSDLYYHNEYENRPVKFHEKPDEEKLILQFEEAVETASIKVFTIVAGRYVEFELEIIEKSEDQPDAFCYITKLMNCYLALEKREYERVFFKEIMPEVHSISLMKVKEDEKSFAKSLSIKMIIEEFVDKIKNFDNKNLFYKVDKNLPPEIRFVMESGEHLIVKDMDGIHEFLDEKKKSVEDSNLKEMLDELDQKVKQVKSSTKSMLVRPIEYHSLLGKQLNIGYLYLSTDERQIDENDDEYIDKFLIDLSDKIRMGNSVESQVSGFVRDISEGGVKIEITDEKLAAKLAVQDACILEIGLIEKKPLRMSGKIIYLCRHDDGRFCIGIDFQASHFGPKLKSVITNHVNHYLRTTGQ